MSSQKNIFNKIQNETNLRPEDIYQMASSIKSADFSNERAVRNIVQQISKMAGKNLSVEKENKIIESIVNNKVPSDLQDLNKFL